MSIADTNDTHTPVPADGVPNFTKKKSQGGFEVGFGGVGSRRSLPPFAEADMTEALKERVYYVMLDAFDNYPPQEVRSMMFVPKDREKDEIHLCLFFLLFRLVVETFDWKPTKCIIKIIINMHQQH